MKKLIMLILSSTTVLMSSMKVIKLILLDKLLLTRREKKLRCSGHLQLMMRWQWWCSEMLLFGRCTKILGILFRESCRSECIQIMISVYHSHGSSMRWIPESITWWLKIKCIFQKMSDHSHPRRILIAAKNSGDHKRISRKKINSVTLTGIQKTPNTISITRAISKEKAPSNSEVLESISEWIKVYKSTIYSHKYI